MSIRYYNKMGVNLQQRLNYLIVNISVISIGLTLLWEPLVIEGNWISKSGYFFVLLGSYFVNLYKFLPSSRSDRQWLKTAISEKPHFTRFITPYTGNSRYLPKWVITEAKKIYPIIVNADAKS